MIRSHTLVKNYTYVSKRDDALARAEPSDDPEEQKKNDEAFEERWQRYLDGTEGVPLRDGAKPTVFHLKHLRAVEKDALSPFLHRMAEDQSQWLRACFAAASLALVKTDHWTDEDGKALQVNHTVVDGMRTVTSETLNQLGYELVLELGGHVISRLSGSPK